MMPNPRRTAVLRVRDWSAVLLLAALAPGCPSTPLAGIRESPEEEARPIDCPDRVQILWDSCDPPSGPEVDRCSQAAARALCDLGIAEKPEPPCSLPLPRGDEFLERVCERLELPKPSRAARDLFKIDLWKAFSSYAPPSIDPAQVSPESVFIRFERFKATPSGAEGRVPVRFHFGPDAGVDWARVAGPTAGGGMMMPRITWEVLVVYDGKGEPALKDSYQPIQASVVVVPERKEAADDGLLIFKDSVPERVLLRRAPPGSATRFNTAVSLQPEGPSDPIQVYPTTTAAINVAPQMLKGTDAARTALELENSATGKVARLQPVARGPGGGVIYTRLGRHLPEGDLRAKVVDAASGRVLSQAEMKAGHWALDLPASLKKGQTAAVRLPWVGSSFPYRPEDKFTVRLRILDRNITFEDGSTQRELTVTARQLQAAAFELARIRAVREGVAQMMTEVMKQAIQNLGR